MKDSIYILGCGGHARTIVDVLKHNNINDEIILVDSNARENEMIMGCKVIANLPEDASKMHVAFGDIGKRKLLVKQEQVSIISADAYVAPSAKIDQGVFIAHNAYIGPEVKIGSGTIINTYSIIEHEVAIGSLCNISPNVTICGRCTIGDEVMLGAGVVVIDKINICDNTIVGAGSVVVKNIKTPGLYVGSPATLIKELIS